MGVVEIEEKYRSSELVNVPTVTEIEEQLRKREWNLVEAVLINFANGEKKSPYEMGSINESKYHAAHIAH